MTQEMIIMIGLFVLALILLPAWPYNRQWSYKPGGMVLLILAAFIMWVVIKHHDSSQKVNKRIKRASDNVQQEGHQLGDRLRQAGRSVADAIRDVIGPK